MKAHIVLALGLVFSSMTSFAANEPEAVAAQARFTLISTSEGFTAVDAKIQVSGAIELKIDSYVLDQNNPWNGTLISSRSVVIADKAALSDYLLKSVYDLSNAELETYISPVICMMMPPATPQDSLSVTRGYDAQTGTYTGVLEEVLSPKGCWIAKRTFPKNQWHRESAERLIESLRTLALVYL